MLQLLSNTLYAKSIVVNHDKPRVVVGRLDEVADIVPSLHPSLSRRHASIQFDGAAWSIVDLCSLNGTLVNGEHVGHVPVVLMNGDQVVLGHKDLNFTVVVA